MRTFIDANILVAVLNKEYSLFSHAARVVSLISDKKFLVNTIPVGHAIAFYFAEKNLGKPWLNKKLICSQ